MNSSDRIGELVPLLEKLQFPYCDVQHENVIRDANGNPVQNRYNDSKNFTDQCPLQTRFLRPACNHCEGHERDPLAEMSYHLEATGRLTPELKTMTEQHSFDAREKIRLDAQIRKARAGGMESVSTIPTREQAEQDAKPFVALHRAIVDRMRDFTAALLQAAKTEGNMV